MMLQAATFQGMDLVNMTTRVKRQTMNRFARLAKRNGRSIASELRIAIDRHLSAEDAPSRKDGLT